MKAEKGDLIRITEESWDDESHIGKIYEVTEARGDGYVYVDAEWNDGSRMNYYPEEYVIHRKAGEEDETVELPDTVEGLPYKRFIGESDAQMTQADRIRTASTELADLLVRKNHDYGDSFSQQYGKYGLMSALIRMDDKMRRLETLQGGQQAEVAESIADTLLDLAGYALLTYVETQKK